VGLFKDESDVYAFIGRLFEELAVDPMLAPKFQKANTTVQYQMSDPESRITIDLRPDRDIRVDFGPSDMDPEVIMSTSADTAHGFWLGKVNITAALARGQIKAKGPVAKILKLVPLTKPVFPRYKAQLEADGHEDLVSVD
jgi:putative sterol carrier protein